jgi:hypothetical protein
MVVLQELFGTAIGLLSLFTIGFIILMGFWLMWFTKRHEREEEQQMGKGGK